MEPKIGWVWLCRMAVLFLLCWCFLFLFSFSVCFFLLDLDLNYNPGYCRCFDGHSSDVDPTPSIFCASSHQRMVPMHFLSPVNSAGSPLLFSPLSQVGLGLVMSDGWVPFALRCWLFVFFLSFFFLLLDLKSYTLKLSGRWVI